MLARIIKRRSLQVYICPIDELNRHFPGHIIARLLQPDEVVVIDYHTYRMPGTQRYFITPREPTK